METYLHRYLLGEAEKYLDLLSNEDFRAMTHNHTEFHDALNMVVAKQCEKRKIRNKSSFLAAFFGQSTRNMRKFFKKMT